MTCPRTPSYVQSLLKMMFERQDMSVPFAVPVRVVVDGGDSLYLGPWTIDPRVKIDVPQMPSTEPIGHPKRILRTFRRCIDGAAPGCSLILLQDDTEVSQDWLTRSYAGYNAVLAELWSIQQTDQSFILSLFTTVPYGRKHGTVELMPTDDFNGTVGILFPPAFIPAFRDYCRTINEETPDDMALKRYIKEIGGRIYNLNPSVVQHVGRRSTHTDAEQQASSPTYRG